MTPPLATATLLTLIYLKMKYIILITLVLILFLSMKFFGKNNAIEEAIENMIEKEYNIDIEFNEEKK
jgi:hypothetical protein